MKCVHRICACGLALVADAINTLPPVLHELQQPIEAGSCRCGADRWRASITTTSDSVAACSIAPVCSASLAARRHCPQLPAASPSCRCPSSLLPSPQFEIATAFGAFLDPVADKVMVTTVLVLLSLSPPAPISESQMAVPVIIMCCREVTMSALREWAASASSSAHKVICGVAVIGVGHCLTTTSTSWQEGQSGCLHLWVLLPL